MIYKKLLFLVFSILGLFTLSSKVNAINIAECEYSSTTLLLPVTVGVEVNGMDTFFPFDSTKYTYYEDTIYVHDSTTCAYTFTLPQSTNRYLYGFKYFYVYNNVKSYVNYIGGGTYKEMDLTSPTFTSLFGDTIEANVDYQIQLDDILGFITVTDNREGNIIPEITYDSYSENYNKIGTYNIVYRACDKSNNCTSFTLKINVKDTTPPTISGNNKFDSYMSNPLSINDILSKLVAIDNHDGIVSDKIILASSNYNPNIPGTYYAYFSAHDFSNNKTSADYKVTINVYDDIAPTIEGPTYFKSYLSSPLQLDDITSQLIMNDNIDYNVIHNTYIISDTYSNNTNKIGAYKVILATYDKAGNEAIPYSIDIEVIDDILPTIEGENLYETFLSSQITILEIKAKLIANDNYDGNLLNKLEIIEDSYSLNKNKIGVYYINFIVKDSSGNISLPFLVEINVFDDINPIIEGINTYYSLTSQKLDIMAIKLNLTANDNIDGNISENIELNDDFYSQNYNVSGSYFITFYVGDKSGNISSMFRVKIIVNEDLTYLESINNSYVFFSTDSYINDEDILKFLSINIDDYNSISTLENNYLTNYNKEGTYTIKYEFENTDYSKYVLTLNVVTNDSETNDKKSINSNTEQNKKETIFTKIISFFTNIFFNIGRFFKNLFS